MAANSSTSDDESTFTMRLSDDQKTKQSTNSSPPIFPQVVDRKGPKTIGIIMIIGALLTGILGFGDMQNQFVEEIPDSEIETLLATPNSQGENLTVDDYQDFHDEARSSHAYLFRGALMFAGSLLICVGGVGLFLLRKWGAITGLIGVAITLIGGIGGGLNIQSAAAEHLGGQLELAYSLQVYLCGICMGMCGLITALPLFNVGARNALNGKAMEIHFEEE